MSTPSKNSGRFNPWKIFNGAFLPNWLLCRTEVSPGAKLAYARLMQFAGRKGKCHPKQASIADELGVSSRQVRDYLAELEQHGLIESERHWKLRHYFFTWHPWIGEDDSQRNNPSGDKDTSQRNNPSGDQRNNPSGDQRNNPSGDKRRRIILKDSGEERGEAEVAKTGEEFVQEWNRKAEESGLPKALTVTKGRLAAIKARLSEPFFREHWREGIQKMVASDFCRGMSDRGWRADIEFFLRPDSLAKILEGKYDNRKPPEKPAPKVIDGMTDEEWLAAVRAR